MYVPFIVRDLRSVRVLVSVGPKMRPQTMCGIEVLRCGATGYGAGVVPFNTSKILGCGQRPFSITVVVQKSVGTYRHQVNI